MTILAVLTERQRQLVRHALGLDGRAKTTHRNHFAVGPGCDDYEDWMDLVAKGYARHRGGSSTPDSVDIFWVTRETALLVRNFDENLSDDFRDIP
jgi:hypothetical protein